MAITKKESAPYQPVFPKQFPKECQSCKASLSCEKFVVKGRKGSACIFICPKNPGMTADGRPIFLAKVKEVPDERHGKRAAVFTPAEKTVPQPKKKVPQAKMGVPQAKKAVPHPKNGVPQQRET